MRVICVKVGDKYSSEWVFRLKAMLEKHLKIRHDFVCITDSSIEGINCISPAKDLPGWWAKINLAEPGRFPGLNLYLDLDVVITQKIDPIIDIYGGFIDKVSARDDFSYSLLQPKRGLGDDMQRLLGGPGTIQSSVLIWRDDAMAPVWNEFHNEKMREVHGDQNWMTQALWPEHIELIDEKFVCSYKYHVLRGQSAAPVVVFHGEPKVTQLSSDDPLRRIWESSWE